MISTPRFRCAPPLRLRAVRPLAVGPSPYCAPPLPAILLPSTPCLGCSPTDAADAQARGAHLSPAFAQHASCSYALPCPRAVGLPDPPPARRAVQRTSLPWHLLACSPSCTVQQPPTILPPHLPACSSSCAAHSPPSPAATCLTLELISRRFARTAIFSSGRTAHQPPSTSARLLPELCNTAAADQPPSPPAYLLRSARPTRHLPACSSSCAAHQLHAPYVCLLLEACSAAAVTRLPRHLSTCPSSCAVQQPSARLNCQLHACPRAVQRTRPNRLAGPLSGLHGSATAYSPFIAA